MQHRLAAPSHLILPVGQPSQREVPDSFLYCLSGPQAQVASGLFSLPAPDGLISVEVRAVARQVHEPQVQLRRPQVFPQLLATMGWGIVPDHVQPPAVPPPQLLQEGNRGPGVAVALQVPSTPPPQSPGIPPSSSWPSPRTWDWSSPAMPVLLRAPTCPATRRRPGSGPRRQRIPWLRSVGPPSQGRHTPQRRPSASTHWP